MHEEHGLSIWFFVGGMLTIYGIITIIANLPGMSPVESAHVVLSQLHAGMWWGIILLLLGLLFLFLHWPGKRTTLDAPDDNILPGEEGKV